MKAILGVVAIVAVIATIEAYVPEFDEDNVYVYSSADPEAEVSTVQLYNADVERKFQVSDTPMQEVNLIPDSLADPEQLTKADCGKALGIHVTNIGKTFCNFTNFYMAVESYDEEYSTEQNTREVEEQLLQFSLYFDSKEQPLLIEVPVLQIPTALASASEKELQEWAGDNEVGVLSPVDETNLDVLSKKGEWQGNFKWLEEVMSYGIVQSEGTYQITETKTEVKVYTTRRPLLLSAAVIDKFIQVVEEYKKKYKE